MKRILFFVLAFLLIPFYPLIKRTARAMSEKIKIGEKVVVVLSSNNRKRRIQ